jgi:hypothetical protein
MRDLETHGHAAGFDVNSSWTVSFTVPFRNGTQRPMPERFWRVSAQ